ncbi:MAG: glycosyltransferase family 39 protein, partial [Anaerolineae bacterium]|nr:glycosyltransferase family 39 protein [Anaerolineae bacterium]
MSELPVTPSALPPTEPPVTPEPPATPAPPVPATPEPPYASRRGFGLDGQSVLIGLLLVVILVSGAYLRFLGQNWDDFTHLHPDERFLTGVVAGLSPVAGPGEYFDTAASSLNPNNRGAGFYVYGTLPLFVVKAASGIVAEITGDVAWAGYNGAHLVGRNVSAIADLVTIFFLFLIGRRLYGRWVGLLTAALYAWAVLPIQLAHFWTMDAFTTMTVAVAFWFGARILDDGGRWNYIGFGVALGAAVSSRINVVPLALVAALATFVRVLPALDVKIAVPNRQGLIRREAGGLLLAAIVSVAAFRLMQPYAFAGPSIFGILPNLDWWAQMSEVSRQVSGQVDFPPNHQWASRIPYLFSWQNIVLWGMGLPLGLAAWGAWAAAGWRILRGGRDWARHLLPVTWILVYYAWQGGGWVMSMRYYLPLYPFLALLAAWGLMALVQRAGRVSGLARAGALALLVLVTAFTLVWGFGYSRVYTRQLTRVQASHWIFQNIPADFSLTISAPDGEQRMVNIGLSNDVTTHPSDLVANATRYFADGAFRYARFHAPLTGEVSAIHAEYVGDPGQDSDEETLWVGILDVAEDTVIAESRITADFSAGDSPLGQSYEFVFEQPVTLEAGRQYEFRSVAEAGAPITVAGAAIATEGPWDDPIPWKVCALPDGMAWTPDLPPGLVSLQDCVGVDPFGMGYYQGLELFMAAEDNEQKRETMQRVLDQADYLTISSNRFYDTLTRLPMRFPMSVRYYDALFSGELGFELIQTFESTFTFGDFTVSDQVLPTYDVPGWLNEFEAEEAFHVYDHPVVFVFQKTEDYDPDVVAAVLDGVSLVSANDTTAYSDGTRTIGVIPWNALQASAAPTALMFSDEAWEIQTGGGTWSDLYDTDALINRSQIAAVIAWWLLLTVIGWLAWPLLFALLPALPDRGFPVAKISGLLLVAWLAWYGASLRLGTWSRGGLLLALGIVALLSLLLGWRHRQAMAAYVREYWRRLLAMEGLALLLFVAFLGVRLGNPDLWHPNFGGERPMDFAYLNAVLRSTVFPPINPWFAGGYINYYYFGFVLLGTPIKLLGLVPSVAFNLILATLFSLTGMAAFSAAFNLVGSWRRADGRLRGSPWIAGGAALALAVILGNLDNLRLIVMALARTGGWQPVSGEEFLPTFGEVLTGLTNVLSGQPLAFST